MPETDEGKWKGGARAFFLNTVWKDIINATSTSVIRDIAGRHASLLPALNCDLHMDGKGSERQRRQGERLWGAGAVGWEGRPSVSDCHLHRQRQTCQRTCRKLWSRAQPLAL